MRTLYLRNVPDDVVERLETLARDADMSVSAYAVRALAEFSRRADNPTLLGRLPDIGVGPEVAVTVLGEARRAR